jgi:hypothetical protein
VNGNDRAITGIASLAHAAVHTYEMTVPLFVVVWLTEFDVIPLGVASVDVTTATVGVVVDDAGGVTVADNRLVNSSSRGVQVAGDLPPRFDLRVQTTAGVPELVPPAVVEGHRNRAPSGVCPRGVPIQPERGDEGLLSEPCRTDHISGVRDLCRRARVLGAEAEGEPLPDLYLSIARPLENLTIWGL